MDMDVRVIRAGGPGLSSFLSLAVRSWRSALGRNLTGVYVSGSISTGAFNPRTSDLDVVATTRVVTDSAANERIHEVHRALHGWSPDRWADRLEVMFIPASALGMAGVPRIAVLELHPDEGFKVQPLGADFMIQKRILRQHGITLYGPKIAKVVAPVTNGSCGTGSSATSAIGGGPSSSIRGSS
jgi:predicted nucleotidyltransferase